jgi:opacity protein-like surface antigen
MTYRVFAAAFLASLPTVGQAEKWQYDATVYGWLPGLDTSISTRFGDFESSSAGSDVLSNLEGVFMGTFELRKGPWGLLTDLLYVDLSDTQSTPFGTLFASGTVDVTAKAASAYATYRFSESDIAVYDVAVGMRYFDLETGISLAPGVLAAQSSTLGDDWIDPVIGLRGSWTLSDDWSASAFADFGSSGSSSETWQVLGTLNYSINDNFAVRFGYRHMDINRKVGGSKIDIALSGPIIGLSYRF